MVSRNMLDVDSIINMIEKHQVGSIPQSMVDDTKITKDALPTNSKTIDTASIYKQKAK